MLVKVMSILNICDNADVLSAMRMVRILIMIIRIAVPIILILSLMIGYLKAVKNIDDLALNKVNKTAINKIVAAILVFFIPTLVNLLADILDVNKNSYISCIKIATKENIDVALYKSALTKVQQARSSIEEADYNLAVSETNKVKDENDKSTLIIQLNEIADYIKLKNQIISLNTNYDRAKYEMAKDNVKKVPDQKVKEKLEKLLSEVNTKEKINSESGLHYYKNSKYEYYDVIPPNITTNMPLMIYLHENGNFNDNSFTKYIETRQAYGKEEFIYVSPHPSNYGSNKWNSFETRESLKSFIDDIINKYDCDRSRIILVGYSDGASAVWDMVSAYPNFFSAAIIVSGNANAFNAKNFFNTKVWALSGDAEDESKYITKMQELVKEINSYGGYAEYIMKENKNHKQMKNALNDNSLINIAVSEKRS